jgi:hypothetical protein
MAQRAFFQSAFDVRPIKVKGREADIPDLRSSFR